MTAAADEDARQLEEERLRTELTKVKREVVRVSKAEPLKKKVASSSHTLTELQALRLKLAAAEGLLSQHVHICLGDDGAKDCGLKIIHLEVSANGQQKDKPGKGHCYPTLIVLGGGGCIKGCAA